MVGSVVSVLLGLVMPVVIEYLKREPWVPFFKLHGGWINGVLAAVLAAGQVVGVQVAFDAVGHTLQISGLDMVSMSTMAVTAFVAWLTQQLTYVGVVKR